MFSLGGFRNLFILVGLSVMLLFMYNSINNLKQRNIALKNENDKLIASVGRVLLKNRTLFPELNLPIANLPLANLPLANLPPVNVQTEKTTTGDEMSSLVAPPAAAVVPSVGSVDGHK